MLDMFAQTQDKDYYKTTLQKMAALRIPKRASSAWCLMRLTRVALCLLLLVGLVSLALATMEKDDQEQQQQQQDDKQNQEQQHQLGRQYFKVNVVPGRKQAGLSSKKLAAKMAAKSSGKTVQIKLHSLGGGSKLAQTGSPVAAAAGTGATDELSIRSVKKGQKVEEKEEAAATPGSRQNQAAGVKQRPPTTISSTTLKKLLNQTLSKSAANNSSSQAQTNGGGGSGGPKTSNFKFVFIQRATAAPHRSISQKNNSSISSNNSNDNKGNSQPSRTTLNAGDKHRQSSANRAGGKLDPVQPAPAQPKASLAASVSKQLASTLLNSAAGLVADLSSVPSLSSLASQFVAASLDNNDNSKQPGSLNYIGDSPVGLRRNSTSVSGGGGVSTESSSDDSKQQQQQQQSSDDFEITKKTAPSSSSGSGIGGTKKAASSKSRPSKIYNLPVKFVANGQPNHVVFHTLKEHFATIKRLQAMGTKSAHSQQQAGGGGEHSSKQQQRKKQQRHRLKGTNSRLIYLPLRYLSNAKPNKTSSAKASSKAAQQKP